jgi:hypothetical protein
VKTRFEFEEEIGQLYHFVDQLNTLSEGILEHNLSNDEIVNVLQGLKVMINLQATKLHDTMNQCFKLDQYNEI